MNAACLNAARLTASLCCGFVLAGCLEPSKLENAEELVAAAALRDGGLPGPAAGSGGAISGSGGSGGNSVTAGTGGRSGSGGSDGSTAGSAGGGRGGSGGSGGTNAGAGGGGGGMGGDDCGDLVADFLTPTCATQFCHGAMGTSALKLTDSDLGAALIGIEASMMCEGELYIDPEAPEQSLLYTKLGSSPPCGLRMPLGGMQVSDDDRACVLQWINDTIAGQ